MNKDLLVIGGGINGVGIAADAAGRGLSVVLCEMGDLASGTSSASSKLIHGGLRYLENKEFKLVRESLQERRILSNLAPHLIHNQAFILPHCPWLRSYWLIRAGLFLYDFLAADPKIPKSQALSKQELVKLELQQQYTRALRYYDCTEDDSRLVLHVALLAQQHSAEILTYTKLVKALRKADGWLVTLAKGNELKVYHVKAVVNATGPWVQTVANDILQINTGAQAKLVKGSHIIVPRIFSHNQAFILQNKDGRIIFLIPYQNDFTLIGTTDILLERLVTPVTVSKEEIDYLCTVTNEFIQKPINATDVIYSYAGIRCLYDDHKTNISNMSRDYFLDINEDILGAPVISIFGGKITTYRNLAENLCNKLHKYFPKLGKAWTKKGYLPGGYFLGNNVQEFIEHYNRVYNYLDPKLIEHYVYNYGTRCADLLRPVRKKSDLGKHFGAQLYQREVDFLLAEEWATCAQDILWRRGKMGLWLNQKQVNELNRYIIYQLFI